MTGAARKLDPLDDAAQVQASVGKLRALLLEEMAPAKVAKILEQLQSLGPVDAHRLPSPEMQAVARRMLRERRGR